MTFFAVPLAIALTAGPEPLLVASYQSLGVDAATVTTVTEGFRKAAARPNLAPLPSAESEKVARSAVMCGEDGACLATVGQRSGARWVLAFGVGKVGTSLLLSALFVDVVAGKELMRGQRRVAEASPDWAAATQALADEVVKPPADPLVVQVPFQVPERSHRWRTAALVFSGFALGTGLVSTIVGAIAWGHFTILKDSTDVVAHARLEVEQRQLNATGDAMLIIAGLTGITALVCFIMDWRTPAPFIDTGVTPPPVVTWW